jgi:hypothetical protein
MSFNAGDVFDVLDSSNPAWYSAKNHRTGAIGYVPVNFTEAVSETTQASAPKKETAPAEAKQPAVAAKPAQSSAPGGISLADVQNIRLKPSDTEKTRTSIATAEPPKRQEPAPRQQEAAQPAMTEDNIITYAESPQSVKKPVAKPATLPKTGVQPKV